jgi:hypothetical protein
MYLHPVFVIFRKIKGKMGNFLAFLSKVFASSSTKSCQSSCKFSKKYKRHFYNTSIFAHISMYFGMHISILSKHEPCKFQFSWSKCIKTYGYFGGAFGLIWKGRKWPKPAQQFEVVLAIVIKLKCHSLLHRAIN